MPAARTRRGSVRQAEPQAAGAGTRFVACDHAEHRPPEHRARPRLRPRHEAVQPRHRRGSVRAAGERTERIPEGRAEGVEGRDLLPGERPRQPVAQRIAEDEAGSPQIDAGAVHPPDERDTGRALGRERGSQVQQAVAVDRADGVDALVVGRREYPRDQPRVRNLVAEVVLHHHQRARHHGRRIGCSVGGVGIPRPRFVGVGMGSEIGRADTLAGGGNAPLRGDAAAVGEGGDLVVAVAVAVPGQGHDGDHVAAQLRNPRRQSRVEVGRPGVDAISGYAVAVDIRLAEGRDGREVGGIAGVAVTVSGGEDENRLLAGAVLRESGDRSPEIGANLLFAVLLDDSRIADAHVHEVNGPARPADHAIEQRRPIIVLGIEGGQRYRNIVAAAAAGTGRKGEHRHVRTPGDAACGAHITCMRGARPRHDHARDRGTVGDPVSGLVRCRAVKHLGQRLAGEHRMILVDPSVDQADRLAAAGCRVDAALQLQLRPGPVRPDGVQAPLILEIVRAVVLVLDLLPLRLVLRLRQATQNGLNAVRSGIRGWGWGWG